MDMYSYYRNLFDMLSDICSDTLFGIYSYWQSDILSDIYSVMLSGILSDIIIIICGHCICNFLWYSELLTYTVFEHSIWHLGIISGIAQKAWELPMLPGSQSGASPTQVFDHFRDWLNSLNTWVVLLYGL